MARTPRRRSPPRPVTSPLLWGLLCVAAVAVIVAATRAGTDLLALTVLAVILIGVERTAGDFLGELLGPGLGSLVLATGVLAVVWYLLSGVARAPALNLFAAADRYGYHTLWVDAGSAGAGSAPQPASPGPVAAMASSTPTSGQAASSASATRHRDNANSRQPVALATRPTAGNRAATSIALVTSPGIATTGTEVVVTAHVSANGQKVTEGSVAFAVDGRRIGSAVIDANGRAATDFVPRRPGSYTLRAAYRGTSTFSPSSTSAPMTVLPGKF